MKLKYAKSNYIIINFCKNHQFNTRLNDLLAQQKETKLLSVLIWDDLKWHSNAASIVVWYYQRMMILRNLYTFSVPVADMVNIYC